MRERRAQRPLPPRAGAGRRAAGERTPDPGQAGSPYPPRRALRPTRSARRRTATVLPLLLLLALATASAATAWHRYQRAQATVRRAEGAIRAGHYTAALAGLQQAAGLWPWLALAPEQARARALEASSRAWAAGMVALRSGRYRQAVCALRQVLPSDVHAAQAQRQLAQLGQAQADAALAEAAQRAAQGVAADAAAFTATYRATMAELVPAWEQFGFGNPVPYEAAAAPEAAQLTRQAQALGRDASALAALPAGPGQDRADLGQARTLLRQTAQVAEGIAQRAADALKSLKAGNLLEVNRQVPGDISTLTAASADLQVDAAAAQAAIAHYAQALLARLAQLLGRTVAPAALLPQGSPTACAPRP